MSDNRYYVFDGPTDKEGKRPFTLFWLDDGGRFNEGSPERASTEVKNKSGKIIGYRRAQCFRAKPADILRPHDIEGLPPWETK